MEMAPDPLSPGRRRGIERLTEFQGVEYAFELGLYLLQLLLGRHPSQVRNATRDGTAQKNPYAHRRPEGRECGNRPTADCSRISTSDTEPSRLITK